MPLPVRVLHALRVLQMSNVTQYSIVIGAFEQC